MHLSPHPNGAPTHRSEADNRARRSVRFMWSVALALLVVWVTAACSSNSSPTSASPTGTAGGKQPVTITVTLTEFGIKSSRTDFQVGVPYHFVVKNDGKVPHELMIMQPMKPGAMTMTEMDKMAVGHIEADDLGAGKTAEMDLTFGKAFASGSLEFACHIAGHYEAGMHAAMTVK